MISRERENVGIQQQETISVDDAFGTVTCRECHTIWPREFAPEFCTKCGIHITSQPGKGFERLISAVEQGFPSVKITICPRCGERYLKESCPEKCFRCWNELKPHGWFYRLIHKILSKAN